MFARSPQHPKLQQNKMTMNQSMYQMMVMDVALQQKKMKVMEVPLQQKKMKKMKVMKTMTVPMLTSACVQDTTIQ